MTEILDLGNAESIAARRDLLIANMADVLAIAGAREQIQQLEGGDFDQVVDWLRNYVSTGGHGANAGDFGLNPDQTRQFNPIAQRVGLMAPGRLWTPEDDLPSGVLPGDIADYSVTPKWEALPEEIFKAEETITVDATVDGSIGRIDTGLGAAARSEAAMAGAAGELVVLTGLRAVKPGEGASGLYRQFLPVGADEAIPIDVAFPAATDAVLAILAKRCSRKFELIHEVEDPQAGSKSADRTHPTVAPQGRTWIARYYEAIHDETGKPMLITVVNGEPIAPTGDELNRSTSEPAPRAAATLLDYLALPFTLNRERRNLAISYAHLGRIGAELRAAVAREGVGLGSLALLGNMPQPATWNKIINGKHNGGTLGAKEYFPLIQALNALLGRPKGDLSRD